MNVPLPQTFAGLSAKAALKRKTNVRLQFRLQLNRTWKSVITWRHGGHISLPNESWGSQTLFLCKHFLLSQQICIGAGHVSENALLQKSTRCQNLSGKNLKFTRVAVAFAHWNFYCFRPSKNRKNSYGQKLRLWRISTANKSKGLTALSFYVSLKKWSHDLLVLFGILVVIFFYCKIFEKTKYLGFLWQKEYIETKLKLKQFQSLENYLNVTCFHHNNRHEKKLLNLRIGWKQCSFIKHRAKTRKYNAKTR